MTDIAIDRFESCRYRLADHGLHHYSYLAIAILFAVFEPVVITAVKAASMRYTILAMASLKLVAVTIADSSFFATCPHETVGSSDTRRSATLLIVPSLSECCITVSAVCRLVDVLVTGADDHRVARVECYGLATPPIAAKRGGRL